MKNKKIFLSLIVVLLIIFLSLFFYLKNNNKNEKQIENNLADEALKEYYINEKGQKWFVKKEKFDFQVISQEKYPKFVRGYLDPLKVSLGDIQKMEVVVQAREMPKKVWAEIQHDNGYDKVELKLIKEELLTKKNNLPFLVDENGYLVLKNDQDNKFDFISEKILKKALAENVKEYTYYGEWQVHSTQTKKYHTIFYVEDFTGLKDKMVLAWSDPCTIDNNGAIVGNCTLSAVDGVDNIDASFGGRYNVTIYSGGLFVFNPGKKISIGEGKFMIGSGAQGIKEGYLYYKDNDGDGYILGDSGSPTKFFKDNQGDEFGRYYSNNTYLTRVYIATTTFILETSSFPSNVLQASLLKNNLAYLNLDNKNNKDNIFKKFIYNKAEAYMMCSIGSGNNYQNDNCADYNNQIYCCYYPFLPPISVSSSWSNVSNIISNDNSGASVTLGSTASSSKWLKITGFNFSGLKDYAIIDDIKVEIKARSNNSANILVSLYGKEDGLEYYSFAKKVNINNSNYVVYTITSSTENYEGDLLNWSFKPTIKHIKKIDNYDFGIALRAVRSGLSTTTISVDYVKLIVVYKIGANFSLTEFDCDDNDSLTHPGQDLYFPDNKDYNCSGGIEFYPTSTVINAYDNVCKSISNLNIFQKISNFISKKIFSYIMPIDCGGSVGWLYDEPLSGVNCGQEIDYSYGCESCSGGGMIHYYRKVYCH